jgi:hypothetical protein
LETLASVKVGQNKYMCWWYYYKKIGKPPLLWEGKGGSMKGGSIIMADLDQGAREVEGVLEQNRRKKDGDVTAEVFCMT